MDGLEARSSQLMPDASPRAQCAHFNIKGVSLFCDRLWLFVDNRKGYVYIISLLVIVLERLKDITITKGNRT